MTRERARQVLIPVVACAALLGLLLVLTSNLDDVALGPGTVSPEIVPAGAVEPAHGQSVDLDIRWLRHLLFAAFTASLAIVLISALLSRLLRRWLYFTIGLFGAILAFDFFVSKIPAGTHVGTDDAAVARIAEEALTQASESDWSRVLIALGLSVGTGAVLVAGSSCAARWWRAHRARRRESDVVWELEQLAERTLSAGSDRDLVVRCYHEMLELLSRKEQIPHASLTAREFADRLRDLSLPTDAIDRLTELFELVRYGHRDSEPLADGALRTLETIRREEPPEQG